MTFVFNPIRDIIRTSDLQKDFDTLFNGIRQERTWIPSVEINEKEDAFTVEVDLPGLTKDDVKIAVESNVLTITGTRKSKTGEQPKMYRHNERDFGSFKRSFNLSSMINTTKIDAAYENGVLTLTLPKAESAKPREVEIRIA